jgi:hypothetical protein
VSTVAARQARASNVPPSVPSIRAQIAITVEKTNGPHRCEPLSQTITLWNQATAHFVGRHVILLSQESRDLATIRRCPISRAIARGSRQGSEFQDLAWRRIEPLDRSEEPWFGSRFTTIDRPDTTALEKQPRLHGCNIVEACSAYDVIFGNNRQSEVRTRTIQLGCQIVARSKYERQANEAAAI